MTGKWGVYRRGQRWRRSPRRAWLVIRTDQHEVVEFDGPVLELMTESRTRFDRRLAALGPDVLGAGARRARLPRAACARTTRRAASATRCSTSATSPASGTCGRPRAASWPGSTPGGRLGEVSDDEALAVVRAVRPLMQESAAGRLPRAALGLRPRRAALPPLRHADPRPRPGRRQPHDLLVPGVPGLIRVGHKGADHVAPGNTIESFEAALEHGVDMIEFDVLRAARRPAGAGPRLRGRRGARLPHARRGPRPLRGQRLRGRRARRRHEAARLRARGGRGTRRARARGARRSCRRCTPRASTAWASSPRGCAAAGRCRACGATTPRSVLAAARLPGRARLARAAARARPRRACARAAARRSWRTGSWSAGGW